MPLLQQHLVGQAGERVVQRAVGVLAGERFEERTRTVTMARVPSRRWTSTSS